MAEKQVSSGRLIHGNGDDSTPWNINGTYIGHTATALQDFMIGYMGFIQSAKLTTGAYDAHEYYMPKTLPFTQDGIKYDFRLMQDHHSPPPTPLQFSVANKNVESAANLPDRFIQFLGRKVDGRVVREVGYALGYSLIQGITRPEERAKSVNSAIMLYKTSKSYPVAIDSKRARLIKAGTQFECVALPAIFLAGRAASGHVRLQPRRGGRNDPLCRLPPGGAAGRSHAPRDTDRQAVYGGREDAVTLCRRRRDGAAWRRGRVGQRRLRIRGSQDSRHQRKVSGR
jgi:hypothetical protein